MATSSKTKKADLLITNIGWLITVDKTRRIVKDAGVAVANGTIVAIGKSKDLITASWTAIAWSTCTATLGIAFLAAGLHGYLCARATMIERVVLIVACFFLVNPNGLAVFAGGKPSAMLTFATDAIGLGLGAIVAMLHLARRRRSPEARDPGVAT